MITSNDESYIQIIDELRSHGAQTTDLARHQSGQGFVLPEFNRLGYNYRMTDIQGAIGIEQMKRVAGILSDRRRLAARYKELLRDRTGIRLPLEPDGYTHVYQSFTLLVEESHAERNRVAKELQELGIATRQGTHAVHALGYYRNKYGLSTHDCPAAWKADQQSMTLPLYASMSNEEQEYVVDTLCKVLG
jgi:dTDP-4-amino-4,6-dideoxygalactose transaminase